MTGQVDSFVLEVRRYDDPDVTRLVAEVQAEYVEIYGGPDEATVDASEFAPPLGLLLVGRLDGEPVATGGWRLLDASGQLAEIKRMYVRRDARRRGLGRVVLDELERRAVATGIRRLVLNTGERQGAAVALYEQAGYSACDAFGHYAGQPGALFYAKDLIPR